MPGEGKPFQRGQSGNASGRPKANPFSRMSEEELNKGINFYLAEVCEPYGSVNATAEALKASPDTRTARLPAISNGPSAMSRKSAKRGQMR